MTKGQKNFMAMLADTADVDGWRLCDDRLRSESGCCPIMAVAGASLDDPPYTGNCAWDGYTEDCGLGSEEGKGMRRRTDRVTRWRDGSMAARWAAAVFLVEEKNYGSILGYKDLWMLNAYVESSALPRLTEGRLPRSMDQAGATATSSYVWGGF